MSVRQPTDASGISSCGADGVMECQLTLMFSRSSLYASVSASAQLFAIRSSSTLTPTKFVPWFDHKWVHLPRRLVNRMKALMKSCVDRPSTSSKCTAFVAIQTNTATHFLSRNLHLPGRGFVSNGPAKSTPECWNGSLCWTRSAVPPPFVCAEHK